MDYVVNRDVFLETNHPQSLMLLSHLTVENRGVIFTFCHDQLYIVS
jgi:hypothetical protein